MAIGNTKEALLERRAYREGDIAISVRQYNLLIGGLLLWGFALNYLIVRFFGVSVVRYAANGGYTVILIGYLLLAVLGTFLIHKDNTITTFIGYNLIAVPVGIVLCVALAGYDAAIIGTAVLYTAIITAAFIALGSIFPNFFLSIGRALFAGLIITLVGGLVTYLIFGSSSYMFWAWFGAGLFAMYIGFDWARCSVCACTVNNAVAAAANLYLDIINLFLRILQILGRKRD